LSTVTHYWTMSFRMAPTVARRRPVNEPHLLALVRAGAVFVNGKNPRSPTLCGMTIHRMDHVGIVVEDLAAAIAFFASLASRSSSTPSTTSSTGCACVAPNSWARWRSTGTSTGTATSAAPTASSSGWSRSSAERHSQHRQRTGLSVGGQGERASDQFHEKHGWALDGQFEDDAGFTPPLREVLGTKLFG
jgi:hypothetical protein